MTITTFRQTMCNRFFGLVVVTALFMDLKAVSIYSGNQLYYSLSLVSSDFDIHIVLNMTVTRDLRHTCSRNLISTYKHVPCIYNFENENFAEGSFLKKLFSNSHCPFAISKIFQFSRLMGY